MSGRLGIYPSLVREAQKKRIQISRNQQKEIHKLYEEIARDLNGELKKHDSKTLTYRWLKDYAASVSKASTGLYNAIKNEMTSSVLATGEAVAEAEKAFYSNLAPALSKRFSDVFSDIPKSVADELLSGGIYHQFAGLSERLWDYQRQFNRDIQTVIVKGIAAQKSAYDLAKDLELYLNPSAKKPWNWGIVYPGTNRKVDYIAQRLARTSVTHAYQMSFQRSTRDNPFVEKYQWHSSNSGRVCSICAARDGMYYEKDQLPLDHPNGMCAVTAVISKSDDEITDELAAWAKGKPNAGLDKWLNPVEINDTIFYDIYHDEKSLISTKKETGIIFNSDGELLWKGTGEQGRIKVPPEATHFLKENVFSHNHPSNGPLSPGDIVNLWKNDLAEIRAVTKHGTFSIKQPEQWKSTPDRTVLNNEFKRLSSKFMKSGRRRIDNELLTPEEADFLIQRIIMRRITRRLGLEMELIPWKE